MKTLFSSLTLFAVVALQLFTGASLQAQEMTKDQARNQFAQTLALAMSNSGLRDFLKAEAARQFDGDFDILYEAVKNREVSPGRTFASVLVNYGSVSIPNKASFFGTDLCQIDPLLNISFPELEAASVQDWNTATVVPAVAVIETSFIDNGSLTAKGYDIRGSQISFSSTVEPTTLTAVVGPSERVIAVNRATMTTSDGVRLTEGIPSGYQFFMTGGCFDLYIHQLIPLDPPAGGGGSTPDACERDQKTTKDDLYQVTMRTKDDRNWAEGWLYGKLEMEAHIFFADNGLNSSGLTELIKSFSLKRDYYNNDWYTPSLEIFHWLPNTNGDKMLYYWIEDDKNSFEISIPLKLNLKILGVGVELGATIKYSEQDEACGSAIIEYCDKANTPGSEYNTGRVKFKVRHRDN